MNIDPKIRLLIRKFFLGELSDNELEELNKWYDSYNNQKQVTVLLDSEEDKAQVKSRIFSKLINEIQQEKKQKRKINFHYGNFIKISIAAVLVIALTIFLNVQSRNSSDSQLLSTSSQLVKRENPNGQKSKIILTDGTVIWLNAASKIKYPEKFDENKREIYLEGEAFFDVAHDENRPFIINTENAVTTVLGTSFNIKSYLEEPVQITVASGKVKVETWSNNTEKQDELLLTVSDQITYLPATGELTKKNVDINLYLSWKEDVIRFDNTKLSEVVKTLERWYDTKITIQNEKLNDCVLVAEYKNEKLFNVLQSLKFSLGIDFENKGNEIIITGKGCN